MKLLPQLLLLQSHFRIILHFFLLLRRRPGRQPPEGEPRQPGEKSRIAGWGAEAVGGPEARHGRQAVGPRGGGHQTVETKVGSLVVEAGQELRGKRHIAVVATARRHDSQLHHRHQPLLFSYLSYLSRVSLLSFTFALARRTSRRARLLSAPCLAVD